MSTFFLRNALVYTVNVIQKVFKHLPSCLQTHIRVHANFFFFICSGQIYTVFDKSSKPSGYKNRGLVQETSERASDCHLPVSNLDQLGLEALELDIPPFARPLSDSGPSLYVIEGHLVLDTMLLACWLLQVKCICPHQ